MGLTRTGGCLSINFYHDFVTDVPLCGLYSGNAAQSITQINATNATCTRHVVRFGMWSAMIRFKVCRAPSCGAFISLEKWIGIAYRIRVRTRT